MLTTINVAAQQLPLLRVTANGRFFETENGIPFFWLGDTGWLLFSKTSRTEAIHYLDTRQQQGFNVIQAMLLHDVRIKNVYGDAALENSDVSKPIVTPDNDTADAVAYDYWDHVEFIVKAAAARGIYMALVPVWGSNVKDGKISTEQAAQYAIFLANRFKPYNNVIWLNGGDIKGSDGKEVWNTIGFTLKQTYARQLMTFHPRGRSSSSEWFQHQSWLDFNMFQSGHKDYAQDTSSKDTYHYGEDNWRHVMADRSRFPVKPVVDGEPSYENIPHGLHDSLAPRWTAADLRRYAYWCIFSGGAGFTYGENAVMQFHRNGDTDGSFGVQHTWKETIHATGASQMVHLKKLMTGYAFTTGVPAQEIIANNTGTRYHYLLALKGNRYAMVYTYTGKTITIHMNRLLRVTKAAWFQPATGKTIAIPSFSKKGMATFDPPGEEANGNDWVLILSW